MVRYGAGFALPRFAITRFYCSPICVQLHRAITRSKPPQSLGDNIAVYTQYFGVARRQNIIHIQSITVPVAGYHFARPAEQYILEQGE